VYNSSVVRHDPRKQEGHQLAYNQGAVNDFKLAGSEVGRVF
jgi:hypothetical protein